MQIECIDRQLRSLFGVIDAMHGQQEIETSWMLRTSAFSRLEKIRDDLAVLAKS